MWLLQRGTTERRIGCRGRKEARKVLLLVMVTVGTLAACLTHVTLLSHDAERAGPGPSRHGGDRTKTLLWRQEAKELHDEGVKTMKGEEEEEEAEEVVGMKKNDPRLVRFVKRRLQPPSILPYNLTRPDQKHYSQYGQSKFLDEHFLHGMTGGLFVEAGALDGEFLSNTLYLEKHLGWSGILVEPMPESYELLRTKNRRASIINAALATSDFASYVSLEREGKRGAASHMIQKEGNATEQRKGRGSKTQVKVLSVPFYSILLALNVRQIDFLSLDLEGFELQVLQTVPWERVKVRVMCVECNKVRPSDLIDLLTSVGYRHLGNFGIDCWFGWPSLLNETLRNSAGNSKRKGKKTA